jgi:hypothetical protein
LTIRTRSWPCCSSARSAAGFAGIVAVGAMGVALIVYGATLHEAVDETAPLPRANVN